MALEFPTMAERALAEYHAAPRTIAFSKIAARYGAERMPESISGKGVIEYCFDDDTSVFITGRGTAHKIWVELP